MTTRVFDSAFAAATAATEIAPGRYAVHIDAGWGVGGRPNGGYLLACLQRAALLAGGREHPLSVSAIFVRPPAPGPAEVAVEPLRAGSTVTSARVRLAQDGRSLVEGLVTTGTLTPDGDGAAGPDWTAAPPTVPPAADGVPSGDRLLDGTEVGLLRHLDVRLDPATAGWAVGRPAVPRCARRSRSPTAPIPTRWSPPSPRMRCRRSSSRSASTAGRRPSR